MSYVASTPAEHATLVTTTQLNRTSDNIQALYDALGADAINPAACGSAEHTNHVTETEGSSLMMFHTFRWLAYGSSGEIVDPTGIGTSGSLSDAGVGVNYFDLDGLDWLSYGMMYEVTGVVYAREFDLKV